MFFLNLSFGEFLILFTSLSAAITALYLLDRTRQKKIVSTLQFWTTAASSDQRQSRRHMNEPWSLLLQLLALLCLLLAIGELMWGSHHAKARDHVLLIDTSAWTAQQLSDRHTVLEQEKRFAVQYMSRIARQDRVLIAAVDGLVTPASSFSMNRAEARAALNHLHTSYTALRFEPALSFGNLTLRTTAERPGELVYIGPARVDGETATSLPPGFRFIRVNADLQNCGIRNVTAVPLRDDPGSWQVTVSLFNYGERQQIVKLQTSFAQTQLAARMVTLPGGEEKSTEYTFHTNTRGVFVAAISPGDSFPEDDRAELRLPRNVPLRAVVYTSRAAALRPLFGSDRELTAVFQPESSFVPRPPADVAIFDGSVPGSSQVAIPSLWLMPPPAQSPVTVVRPSAGVQHMRWNMKAIGGVELEPADSTMPPAQLLHPAPGQIVLAMADEGPTVVAAPSSDSGAFRSVTVGFDLTAPALRYNVSVPLLMANLLHWIAPERSLPAELSAVRVGAQRLTLEGDENGSSVRVTGSRGDVVPFTTEAQTAQIFTTQLDTLRVQSGARVRTLSVSLPDVAPSAWTPPANVNSGLPAATRLPGLQSLWQPLASLALLLLVVEWLLFGRTRARRIASARTETRAAAQEEQVTLR